MFDYERYDHTYCRLNKDVEESDSLKRRFSSASYEALSDVELSDQHSPQISVEKDNGTPLNREPVIIVRTKKPRKTAPIIVKTMNKSSLSVSVSTVNTATTPINSTSIISKNKIVSSVADDAILGNTADSTKEEKAELKEEPSICVPDKNIHDSVQEVTPIVHTTKSGRTRKLTAKAQQISEESLSKALKSSKMKSNASKESQRKRSRGRPKKDGANQIKPSEIKAENPDNTLHTFESTNSTGLAMTSTKEGSNEQVLSNGGANKITSDLQPKCLEKEESKDATTSALPRPSAKQSMQKRKGRPAKSNTKASSKSPSAVKRSPKGTSKSKLVVVTKPPPKRRAQLRAQEQIAAVKGVSTTTHDSVDKVRGGRRRR